MSVSMTSPATRTAPVGGDRYVVVSDPRPGTIVELNPGSQLAVRFRPRLGASRWHVVGLPGHLLELPLRDEDGHEFQFLVFGCATGAAPLRFERRAPGHEMSHEVCEVLVVPVSEAAGSCGTSTSAS